MTTNLILRQAKNDVLNAMEYSKKTRENSCVSYELPSNLKFISDKNYTNKYFLKFLILLADADKYPRLIWDNKFRFVYANQKFLNRIGFTNNELRGKYLLSTEIMTMESVIRSKEAVVKNLENGSLWSEKIVNTWNTKDGKGVKCLWEDGMNDETNGLGTGQCEFI